MKAWVLSSLLFVVGSWPGNLAWGRDCSLTLYTVPSAVSQKIEQLNAAIRSKAVFETNDPDVILAVLRNARCSEFSPGAFDYKIEYRALELDFGSGKLALTYRMNGSAREIRTALSVEINGASKEVGRRLATELEEALEFSKSNRDLNIPELRRRIEEARKTQIKPAKSISVGSKFYHVTKNASSMKQILKNGIELVDGDMGEAVYAVVHENLPALRKWTKDGEWIESSVPLVVEVEVNPNSLVLDIASKEGALAFDAFIRLLRDRRGSALEKYIQEMGADIVIYPWESGGMEAIAIKNPSVLRGVKRVK